MCAYAHVIVVVFILFYYVGLFFFIPIFVFCHFHSLMCVWCRRGFLTHSESDRAARNYYFAFLMFNVLVLYTLGSGFVFSM